MEPLQPLCIADIGFAPGDVLGITRINEKYRKATSVEELENRNPVDAGRFHDNGLDATFLKPVHQLMKVCRESTESPHGLRRTICPDCGHVHGRSNVDGRC